jgi:hypothetical protein
MPAPLTAQQIALYMSKRRAGTHLRVELGHEGQRIGLHSKALAKTVAKACSDLKLKHIRTNPYTPCTKSKAMSFIQTF